MKFQINNRKYLGSKTKLINKIFLEMTPYIKNEYKIVLDLFGGTGIATKFFQEQGFESKINDFLFSNSLIYDAFFGSQQINLIKIKKHFNKIEFKLKPIENWFTELYAEKYFSYNDACEIASIRQYIETATYDLNKREKNILIASLIYSVDKCAHSMGHYDIFIKTTKAKDKFNFQLVDFNSCKKAEIFCEDANELIMKKESVSNILYLDPPYNSRQYSNLYHLLETLTIWEKPNNTLGISLKNQDIIKPSQYSMSKARDFMLHLILNAETNLIVVSYNNFQTKNSRSESKIKMDDLITILELRGKVHVKQLPYRMYASNIKKSRVKDYCEFVLICEVKTPPLNKNNVKYPFNYMGGKTKLLPKILDSFPQKINNFYDLFAGGANVGVNTNADNIYINEKNKYQYNVLKVLKEESPFSLIENLEKIINKYGLSFSAKNKIKKDDDKFLKKYNEKGFLKLRENFNKNKNIYEFIVLIIYGFNNSINFNLKEEYNIPTGKRDLNKNIIKNIFLFSEKMKEKNIYLTNLDYVEVKVTQGKNDVIYLDPPYLISYAHYNKNWNSIEENRLLNYVQSKRNVWLSNILKNGEKENIILKTFIDLNFKNITFFDVETNYDNSWYHKKEKGNHEILIKYNGKLKVDD